MVGKYFILVIDFLLIVLWTLIGHKSAVSGVLLSLGFYLS